MTEEAITSNQGSDRIGQVVDDIMRGGSTIALTDASERLWKEVDRHPRQARCECPGIEFLCRLYELGYRLVPATEVEHLE